MKDSFTSFRPAFRLPPRWPAAPLEWVAFLVGTGLGSGLLRPASGTWGSLAGLPWLWAWALLPGWPLRILVLAAALGVAFWSAGRCAVLFGSKDPSSVVIDEIAPLPFAFWPLVLVHESRLWMWAFAFVVCRAADIIKPWPAKRMEKLPGGYGIVVDDIFSSVYTGLILWALQRWLPHPFLHAS